MDNPKPNRSNLSGFLKAKGRYQSTMVGQCSMGGLFS